MLHWKPPRWFSEGIKVTNVPAAIILDLVTVILYLSINQE